MFLFYLKYFESQIWQPVGAVWALSNVGISEWANTEIAGSLTGFKCQDFDWQATIGQSEGRSWLANQESLYRFTNLILPNIGNKNCCETMFEIEGTAGNM